jgi:hypothetical protein
MDFPLRGKNNCQNAPIFKGGGQDMDSVRAFDIPVDDMERANRFYQSVFG